MSGVEPNLPDVLRARTANVRIVNTLGVLDGFWSWLNSLTNSAANTGVRYALQQLIEFGVPIAARAMINSMSYKLGNSQLPVDTTFAKSSGWAVGLIIVLTIVCVAVVVLVVLCIWWERRLEQRRDRAAAKAMEEEKEEEFGENEGVWGRRELGYAQGSRSSDYDEMSSSSSAVDSSSKSNSTSSSEDSSDSDDEQSAFQSAEVSREENVNGELPPRGPYHGQH